MSSLSGRFFSTTRGRVVQLLSREPQSVSDLATALDLTPNAIRACLATLERDGLVRAARKRAAVRKPETLYELTREADQLFPRAYHVLFSLLLHVLRERMPEHEVQEILRETGGAVARVQSVPPGTLEERARTAVGVLRELGGLPELVEENGRLHIRGERCPLASAVREHPDVCKLAEAMLSEIVGMPVHEVCQRNGEPRCRFQIG